MVSQKCIKITVIRNSRQFLVSYRIREDAWLAPLEISKRNKSTPRRARDAFRATKCVYARLWIRASVFYNKPITREEPEVRKFADGINVRLERIVLPVE